VIVADGPGGGDGAWLARFGAIVGGYLRSAGDMSPGAGAAECTADSLGRDQLGRLGREADLTGHGFTTGRWDFWRRRLEDLTATGGQIAGQAREGLRYLDAPGGQISG
jgi:hypothetical protein